MTIEETQLMDEKFKGISTLVNAQFINVNDKLDTINNHLIKLNGTVASHEKIINERGLVVQELQDFYKNRNNSCPQLPAIQALQITEKINISKKQLIVTTLSIIAIIVTIAVGSLKINETIRSKELQKIQQTDSIYLSKHINNK